MGSQRYPVSLIPLLRNNRYENIFDSNMLTAYIPADFEVPAIDDPRKQCDAPHYDGRHPGYLQHVRINQIFSYIGFIKRINNQRYKKYLPNLFKGLNRFLRVIEEIVFGTDITLTEDIYLEQKKGLEIFLDHYENRSHHGVAWIEKIWKQQKNYLENIDMLLETLKVSGQVFDYKEAPLHHKIVTFCKSYFKGDFQSAPGRTDIRFVANCFSRAVQDQEPKTIWSGDHHVTRILKALENKTSLIKNLPPIYQRANYLPHRFNQLFPQAN